MKEFDVPLISEAKADLDGLVAKLIPTPPQVRTRRKVVEFFRAGEKILRNGTFDDLRIEDLCRLTGSTAPSFYNLFESKERFFAALVTDFARQTFAGLDAIAANLDPKAHSLENLASLLVRFMVHTDRQHRFLTLASFRNVARDPDVRKAMGCMNKLGKGLMLWMLLPHRERIPSDDPERTILVAADIVLALMLQLHIMEVPPFSLGQKDLEERFIEIMLHYLLVPPPVPGKSG